MNILVIDDNRVIAFMTQRVFQLQGHRVEVAFDGPSAIEVARAFRPELILCDLTLPGLSGYEVVKVLKSEGIVPDAMIAAVTGHDTEETRRRIAAAGFHAHLVKPVAQAVLEELIGRLRRSADASAVPRVSAKQ